MAFTPLPKSQHKHMHTLAHTQQNKDNNVILKIEVHLKIR